MTKMQNCPQSGLVERGAVAEKPDKAGLTSDPEISGEHDIEVPEEALKSGEIIIVERRQLVRDAVARGFAASLSWRVRGYATMALCLASVSDWSRTVIVQLVLGEDGDDPIASSIEAMKSAGCPAPLMVLSDCDEASCVVEAFRRGVKGYLPMSVPVRVAAQAIRLVAAGGCYVPVSCLAGKDAVTELAHPAPAPFAKPGEERSCMFTARQTAVIEALRRGKANKVIAYELNMRESTVKVHVRNIMKKLNARNRTEVAYRANEMLELRR